MHEVAEDPDFDRAWAARERIASAAVLPLTLGGELLGVLALYTRRPVPEEVVEALTAFAAVVAATLRDVQLLAREQAARREAEAQRRTLQTVLDTIPVGVLRGRLGPRPLDPGQPGRRGDRRRADPAGHRRAVRRAVPPAIGSTAGATSRRSARSGGTLNEREPLRERLGLPPPRRPRGGARRGHRRPSPAPTAAP